jgi:hypothetical protein
MFVTEWRDLRYNRPHPNWAPYSGIQPLVETVKPRAALATHDDPVNSREV